MAEMLQQRGRPLGGGRIFEARELLSSSLLARLVSYKQNIARSYATVRPENIARDLPRERLFVSTKIDGEQWFLHKNGHGSLLISPSGKALAEVPVTEAADAILGEWSGLIAGELHAEPEAGRARLCDLHAALGGGADAPVGRFRFAAFDLLQDGEVNTEECPFDSRVERLRDLLCADGRVRVVDFWEVEGAESVAVFFEKQVAAGEEGIVARTTQGRAFKIKPRLSFDAAVLAWTETAAGVGEVLLGLCAPDGTGFQVIGRVDTGFKNRERRELAERLRPLASETPIHLVGRSGRPFLWVRPEVVVEVECQEIQTRRSEGASVRRWRLDWQDGAWSALGKSPAASLRHAVFKRLRPDKRAAGVDIRWEQLGLSVEEEIQAPPLPPSELLAREAYAKPARHGLGVRKCVLWKTRKEARDPRYPAFCAFFTDYAPKRKEPLQTELCVADSQEKILAMAAAWRDARIGRGWKRVAAEGAFPSAQPSPTPAFEQAHAGGACLSIAFGRSASPAFPVARRRLDNLAGLGGFKIETDPAGREIWFELRVEKGLVEHYRRIANLLQIVRRWKSLEVMVDDAVLDSFAIDSLMNRLGEIRQCWQRRKHGGRAGCRKEGGFGCRMVKLTPSERFLTGAYTTEPPWHTVGRFEDGAVYIDKTSLRNQLGGRGNRLLRECPLFDHAAVGAAIEALPEKLAPDGLNCRAVCRRSDGLVVWVWPAHLPLPPGLAMRADADGASAMGATGSASPVARVLPPTTYADVCGQEAAVEAVRDLIELPLRHAELFTSIGATARPSGVILAGPPGTGKTLLARAVAGSCGCHLEIVSGPELLNPYVGATEKALREVFGRARNHAPAIILFDELDSLAPSRTTADAQHQRSATAQLLTLLDGLEARRRVFVLATTNLPRHIDPALRRPGRFDRVVWMGPPNRAGRAAILRHYLKPLRLVPGTDPEALVRHLAGKTRGASGADLQHLCQSAARICVKQLAMGKHGTGQPDAAISRGHFEQAIEEIAPGSKE